MFNTTRAWQRSTVALALVSGLALLGCGTSGSGDAAATDAASATGTTTEEPRHEATTVTVPSDTIVTIEFVDTVSSDTSAAGDRFSTRVVEPVSIDGRPVIRAGDEIVGEVVATVPSKKIGGKASLELEFQTLRLSTGEEVPISAVFIEEGEKQTRKDATTIGGATAGGAVLGRIIGHQSDEDARGTSIGALVGAAVGTAIAAKNENDPVVLPEGTVLDLRLDAPVEVTVP